MALANIPGFIGYEATRVSSLDSRAIGKFTDTNSLYSMRLMAPSEYDKKIISLYTQTSLYSNDFLDMINKSSVYYPDNEVWHWDINVPYRYPVIIEIPATTAALTTPGINGQVFDIVFDKKAFFVNDTITADKRYAPQLYVVTDPVPYNMGWKYTVSLTTETPLTTYVDSYWLTVGTNYQRIGNMVGEFDQTLSGLPEIGQKVTLYETMSAGYGFEHKVTKWAQQLSQRDERGNPIDLMVYTQYRINEVGKKVPLNRTWESYIEVLMRQEMLKTKVESFIWSKPGTAKGQGSFQEVKKSIEGLYYRMRNKGNYVSYNRGEFTINLLRNTFGDLFYRRENIQDRRVRIYTNEAGMEVFNTAAKRDAQGSGIVFNVGDNNKFVSGEGQNLKLSMNFSSVWTLDTGWMEIIHLKELDQPQTNTEFGQNKKSTPVFLVFDISPESDGTPKNNIREVRLKNAPSMTWGYINGRTSWNKVESGSQGMMSASMDPAAKVWMEDRCDIFVEDLSRMVLIEEVPQY